MSEEIVLSDRNVPRKPLQDELTRLYSQGFLTDITLSTEDGKNFEAHRVLLAARSTYFHSVVPRLKTEPVIFLKGVKGAHLDKILKFIYGTSVAISKHQLKPILEVAKSLQVKGLQDVTPSEILSRQSVVSAGRFKPDSPLASPLLSTTKVEQQVKRGASSLVDKSTLAMFKSPTAPGSSVSSGRRSRMQQQAPAIAASRLMANGSPANSDSEEEKKDSDEEENTASVGVGTRTRKKRGRPPKKDKSGGKNSGEKAKEDPYEFEEDTNEAGEQQSEGDSKKGFRYKSSEKKRSSRSNPDNDEEDEMSSPVPEDEGKKGKSSSINGKQVLTVKCKGELAELHISKFYSGIRGRSIKYKDSWITPEEFHMVCGFTGKKYLENIQTDYGPLKALTASGMLKPQSRNLRNRDEESSSPSEKRSKKKRRREQEEEEEEEEENEEAGNDEEEADLDTSKEQEKEDEEEEEEEPVPETTEASTETENVVVRGSAKRKKKKHRDDWKRQIVSQLKNETAAMHAQNNSGTHFMSTLGGGEDQPPFIQAEKIDQGNAMMMGSNTMTVATLMDQPPKISPSAILNDPIQQHQQQQPQTLYVMSPHPSIATAPPTPQHNPFANAISPPPQPMYQPVVSMAHSNAPSPVISTYNGNNKVNNGPSTSGAAGTSSQGGAQQGGTSGSLSRIGNILNVRCKSTTALLYANKYESGSKGKCIQLNDEWLTPNEFEDRAGSKAKKYLSSIKCMGRPLRVYVNSGELRGSGPPPQPKGPKGMKKFQTMNIGGGGGNTMLQQAAPLTLAHPIAPAPIQAPPTPTHMSSAPALPPNLNMMMGGQPPILINQTSMASSMMGGSNILPGMTFTIAQPLEVRQSQAM